MSTTFIKVAAPNLPQLTGKIPDVVDQWLNNLATAVYANHGPAITQLQGLLDASGSSVVIGSISTGPHISRGAAANYPTGSLFWETDRTVMYLDTGSAWVYILGTMRGTNNPNQKPLDLSANDTGFLFYATDLNVLFRWSGSAWIATGPGSVYEGPHASRGPVTNYPPNSLFWETDRTYFYIIVTVAGVQVWVYADGTSYGTHAARWADLGVNDTGAQYRETDRNWLYVWNGTAWIWRDGLMTGLVAALPAGLGANDKGADFYASDNYTRYVWSGSVWVTVGGAIFKATVNSATTAQWQDVAAFARMVFSSLSPNTTFTVSNPDADATSNNAFTASGKASLGPIVAENPDPNGFCSLFSLADRANDGTHGVAMGYMGSTFSGTSVTGGPSGIIGYCGTQDAAPFVLYTDNTSAIVIDASQNVGIGAAPTPIRLFTVHGGTNRNLGVSITDATFGTAICLAAINDVAGAYTPMELRASLFAFTTGNVGIGNTNPGALLDLGLAGSILGVIRFAGSVSGNTILAASGAASGLLTLPAAVDTLVGRVTVDTLSNKTLVSPIFQTSAQVGTSGTPLTQVVVYTPSLTPAAVLPATTAEQTFTVTGLATSDKVIVNGPAPTAGTGIVNVRVSAANTLAITFMNATIGALTPTAGTYTVIAIRS